MSKPFLYIHIPKTAGVLIAQSDIVNYKDHWADHSLARDIKNINNFFTFCFLRNPYEKMLSSYNFYKNFHTNKDHNTIKKRGAPTIQQKIQKYKTFNNFILNLNKSKNLCKDQFINSQYDYITDKNGNIIVDFVGDFYKIDTQFYEIQEINNYHKFIIKLSDKKINITPHSDFRDYYNDEVAEIVYNHWKKDFNELNFDKNSYKK